MLGYFVELGPLSRPPMRSGPVPGLCTEYGVSVWDCAKVCSDSEMLRLHRANAVYRP
jgi:hypothetical protein